MKLEHVYAMIRQVCENDLTFAPHSQDPPRCQCYARRKSQGLGNNDAAFPNSIRAHRLGFFQSI
jgi:hypothetical protein